MFVINGAELVLEILSWLPPRSLLRASHSCSQLYELSFAPSLHLQQLECIEKDIRVKIPTRDFRIRRLRLCRQLSKVLRGSVLIGPDEFDPEDLEEFSDKAIFEPVHWWGQLPEGLVRSVNCDVELWDVTAVKFRQFPPVPSVWCEPHVCNSEATWFQEHSRLNDLRGDFGLEDGWSCLIGFGVVQKTLQTTGIRATVQMDAEEWNYVFI